MNNLTFLFLDRLSKLGSKSTSKEQNLLQSFIGSVDHFGSLFSCNFGLLIFLMRGCLCKVIFVCGVALGFARSCSVVLFSYVGIVFELVLKLVFGICGGSCFNQHIIVRMERQTDLCLNEACSNFENVCLCLCCCHMLKRSDQLSGL